MRSIQLRFSQSLCVSGPKDRLVEQDVRVFPIGAEFIELRFRELSLATALCAQDQGESKKKRSKINWPNLT